MNGLYVLFAMNRKLRINSRMRTALLTSTAATLPEDGGLIRNIVLFAVLIYELVGPVMTKWALTKAGDIQPKSEEVLHRRERKLAAAAKK